jgi:hypothetical protein
MTPTALNPSPVSGAEELEMQPAQASADKITISVVVLTTELGKIAQLCCFESQIN